MISEDRCEGKIAANTERELHIAFVVLGALGPKSDCAWGVLPLSLRNVAHESSNFSEKEVGKL